MSRENFDPQTGKILPGKSGNPNGRPKNSTNKAPTEAEFSDMLGRKSKTCLNRIMRKLNDPKISDQDLIKICLGVMSQDLKYKEVLVKKLKIEKEVKILEAELEKESNPTTETEQPPEKAVVRKLQIS